MSGNAPPPTVSTTLEILGTTELTSPLSSARSAFAESKGKLEPPDRLQELWRSSDNRFYRNGHSERTGFLEQAADLARLLHAQGAPADEIRAVLREGAEVFAPILPILDFSTAPRKYSVATRLARRYEGKTLNCASGRIFRPASAKLSPGYKVIEIQIKNQPKNSEAEAALTGALMAWDWELAKRIAQGYDLQPAEPGDTPNHFGLLRQALLGERDNALIFLKNVPKGYDPDFPPKQLELVEGVIRGDASLVKKGLATLSKRFKTAWTLKTYATPDRLRRLGTLEKMLPSIRSHLIGHQWLLSDWGVAWMSLAWHCGMKDAFNEPDLFSEWIPRHLCCPESTVDDSEARPGNG